LPLRRHRQVEEEDGQGCRRGAGDGQPDGHAFGVLLEKEAGEGCGQGHLRNSEKAVDDHLRCLVRAADAGRYVGGTSASMSNNPISTPIPDDTTAVRDWEAAENLLKDWLRRTHESQHTHFEAGRHFSKLN
jgi:hypothetical protein